MVLPKTITFSAQSYGRVKPIAMEPKVGYHGGFD